MESTPAREPEPRPGARGDDGRREPRQLALVALTSDETLLETLESVLANDRRLHVVDRETDLAAALMDPRIGVALLDAAKLQSPLAELTRRLRNQFPDLILVVAGGPEEQAAIASQVASGGVYRFLHKPVSEQRVKLFVEAALRRHGVGQQPAVASVPSRGTASPGSPPRLAVAVGGAAVVLTALVAVWQLHRQPPHVHAPAIRASAPAGSVPPQAPQDPRLAQAREALARGELVAPAGRSAADLYVAVLRSAPEDPDAREGLDQVIDQLCSLAEGEITAGRLDEATRYLESARRLDQQHVRVAYLTTEIANERERAALAAARQRARVRDLAAATPDADESAVIAAQAPGAVAGAPATVPTPASASAPVSAPAPTPATATAAAAAPAAGGVPAGVPPASSPVSPAALPNTVPPAAPLSAPVSPPAAVTPAAVAPGEAPPLAVAPPANAAVPAPAPVAVPVAVPVPPASNIVPASTLHRVKYREPRYPQAARAKNLGGWVDLEFTVRSDGSVGAVQVVGADPPGVFESAAIEAASDWHYLPVLRDGAPVAQRASVRVRFALEP